MTAQSPSYAEPMHHMPTEARLRALAERWADAEPAERANYQLYVVALTEALDVPIPQFAGSGYQFDIPIGMVTIDGTTTTKFADLFMTGHFLLEAKDQEEGPSTDLLLRKAFGQAVQYAVHLDGGPPPFLMVLDIAKTLLVWDRWRGTYGGYQAARRIDLRTLHERPQDIAFLRAIWLDPASLDPREKSNRVTREIAAKLAELASSLEGRGNSNERVARFLMRCVFTMFSEDVGLLADEPFKGAVALGVQHPEEFASAVAELWAAMDEGRRFGLRKLLRFNGHFFTDQEVLPLTREDMAILAEASGADWSEVEPTIFGTLLVRALDPVERHRLGAEYTPREFVERLVRPTIEEPVRAQWALVQAEVLQLRERGRPIDRERAVTRLRAFHDWLRGLRVLDPACGSGNFLYVALATLKSIELEVFREIEAITEMPEIPLGEVDPAQFYGIEVKPWARELAELTLWVGYYQWWRRTHGHTMPPEPVLRDTGTLECRDAVLAWDEIVHVPEKDRPDPTPRIPHPVTQELVPDPAAKLPYYEYVGARQAQWPAADFVVGNPPYLGSKRMRGVLGDGYVDAIREAYSPMPDASDYVMYWWKKAADKVAEQAVIRAGLITTSSIRQSHQRQTVTRALESGVSIVWTAPDHPWVDESGGAAVQVAMTVLAKGGGEGTIVEVDDEGKPTSTRSVTSIQADLTGGADVAAASGIPLQANRGVAYVGYWVSGAGFRLDPDEAASLLAADPSHADIVRPVVNGSDMVQRRRGMFVIDFGARPESEARDWPVLYQIVRDRVKPGRDALRKREVGERWWQFGSVQPALRDALRGIERFLVIPETSKHKVFQFIETDVAPEHALVCITLDDYFSLGVLSSRLHTAWALAAGGRLGVGNDPRYQKARTFDSFPFPDPSAETRSRVAHIAARLDDHRKAALARDESVTMTAMYNVVEKVRVGGALTAKERKIHELAACGVLAELHDELDSAVAEAYGWSWPLDEQEILERLVALQGERVLEEKRGLVRWIRPEYQVPRFGAGATAEVVDLELPEDEPDEAEVAALWPETVTGQLALVRDLLRTRPADVATLARGIRGATRGQIVQHLDALTVLGIVRRDDAATYYVVEGRAATV